jgi:PKD repeat protein
VTYGSAGERTVILQATNGFGGDSFSAPFTVCSEPLTEASFAYTPATAGVPVTFTASLTPADVIPTPSVQWSFGATGLEATTVFEAPGSYAVTVTATNACDQAVYSAMVEVAPVGPEGFFLYLPIVARDY